MNLKKEWQELSKEFGTGGLIAILIICISPIVIFSVALIIEILNGNFNWGLIVGWLFSILWLGFGIRGLWH